jgi:cytochrome c oxidase accessory protein FixG
VCPTGIDIREGLQYQCIGCALCIDAGNSVMQKMHYPQGLIRYTTENALAHKPTHGLRPHVLGYGVAIIVMTLILGVRLATRVPLEVNVIRDRDSLFVETVDGKIENQYTLKIANKAEQDRRYKIEVKGLENFQFLGGDHPAIASGTVEDILVRIVVAKNSQAIANRPIEFVVTDMANTQYSIAKESRFISPSS